MIKFLSDGYMLSLPEQVKLEVGKSGSYLNVLKVTKERIVLKVIRAQLFLEIGYIAVDDNGTSLILLEPDLDRKLVVVGDLNLHFVLQQDSSCFENVWVEVISEFPKSKKWYYLNECLIKRAKALCCSSYKKQ